MSSTLTKRHSRTPVRTGRLPHWSVAQFEADQRRARLGRIAQRGFAALIALGLAMIFLTLAGWGI